MLPPDDAQRLLEAAFTAFDSGRHEEAGALYAHLLAGGGGLDSPLYRQALFGRAFNAALAGHFDTAREDYRILLHAARQRGDRPAEAVLLHQLGMVERLAGSVSAALLYLDLEQELRDAHLPDDPAARSANAYERGEVALGAGDLTAAALAFQIALEKGAVAGDAMCVACAQRGLGDTAARRGLMMEAAQAWQASRAAFKQAGDERGAAEIERRLAGWQP